MTAKHFQGIATTLRIERQPWAVQLRDRDAGRRDDARFALLVIDDVTVALAGTLAGFNPEFDRVRFLLAAGMPRGEA